MTIRWGMRLTGATVACAVATFAVAIAFGAQAHALDAFWHGVRSSDWNHGINPPTNTSNWYSLAPPNGMPRQVPDGTATFAIGALRLTVKVLDDTTIKAMQFPANTPAYKFFVDKLLLINGSGLTNNSTAVPVMVVDGGSLKFDKAAKLIGTAAAAARITTSFGGVLSFYGTSKGGNAIVHNFIAGKTVFQGSSSAEQMSLTNDGASVSEVSFFGRSNGGEARFTNKSPHKLDFSATTGPAGNRKVTAGQIINAGTMSIGLNTVSVLDKVSQSSTGILRLSVTPTLGGRINTTNKAVISGTVVITGQSNLQPGNRVIVHGGGGVSGKFTTVKFVGFASGPKPVLAYTAKDVILKIP